MSSEPARECSFFISILRDKQLADGEPHTAEAWEWLDQELFARFGGYTIAPGLYRGCDTDPHTQQRVDDESYKFIVAVSPEALERLRDLLRQACVEFAQKCIYLNIASQVEFIEATSHESNGSV